MQLILPKTFVDLEEAPVPYSALFFLAGPVRGGGNWQTWMARWLNELVPGCIIAVPCRWGCLNPLYQYRMEGSSDYFARQLNWEQYYLERAGTGTRPGCVVFYLPVENADQPHPGPEPYSMDTRGELGEWRMRMKYEQARVVIGAEKSYLGLSQIQRNFSHVLGYDFPVHTDMETTARTAAVAAFNP